MDAITHPLLDVRDLKVSIFTRWGEVKAANGVSFTLARGRTLGVVGESGSGKSITCLSLLQLLPAGGRIVGGEVLFDGQNLAAKSQREMRQIRGKRIAMILQDPMTSLNPVYTIGNQVDEPVRLHQPLVGEAIRAKAIQALRLLRIPVPEVRVRDFPHQMSGGMRQRVVGAIAMSCEPDLLIADEPTTSLDTTVQAQYLDLLREVQEERGVSMIFVTHDLGIVAKMCHRVAVMYAGRVVEFVSVEGLFDDPRHPYTKALLASVPRHDRRERRLAAIDGQPPVLHEKLPACPFAPRCAMADSRCFNEEPPEVSAGGDHMARCWKV
ncbi:MAG: ABC transporter ATP-binding protein [Alphaproteobacteria bacterium]|nr:ABC transporter ATP-binding protein [Alphaproteobacteria bacterium]